MLASYDVNLDAGTSKAEGGDAMVEFDLKLANGKTLEKPGNAFGVNEGALWCTEKGFSSNIKFDVDGDGKVGFGNQLPDAYVLKAAADKLDALTQELIDTGKSGLHPRAMSSEYWLRTCRWLHRSSLTVGKRVGSSWARKPRAAISM